MFSQTLKKNLEKLCTPLALAVLLAVPTLSPVHAQGDRDGVVTIKVDAPGDTGENARPGAAHRPDKVLVRFRRGAPRVFLPDSGANRQLGEEDLYLVHTPPGLAVSEAVRRYKQNPNVVYSEPDYIVSTTADPTDPLWSQQWDMMKIAAPAAWEVQTNASDVIVAVIDTGVHFAHPDLQGNLWTNPANGSHGYNCLNGSCVSGGQDDQGHGTHVAGTIGAAAGNGTGIAGINWRTQILSCKFLDSNGSGNTSDAILCFNQIRALRQQGFNIRVINNSWGGGGYSQALKDAMEAVEAAGIVNVCAAGNSGVNADLNPMYPAAFDNRGLVSVLASDQNDTGAYFTNYGVGNVDIAAPGVSILSTVPTGTCALCDASGFKYLNGTSMASPHVAGVLAAMFHRNPSLTAAEARDVVLDPASYDPVIEQRASSTSTGGRLNLLKAITNPKLTNPQLNNFPTITGGSSVFANAGDPISLAASAADPDGDPLRLTWQQPSFSVTNHWLMGWMLNQIFPAPSGDSVQFEAPSLARTVTGPYAISASDSKGGSATSIAYASILAAASPGLPPAGNLVVTPTSGPVGTVVSVDFSAVDPDGGPVGWEVWQSGFGGAFGSCCPTGTFNFPINSAGVYRIRTQAIDRELQISNSQSTVVRIGGASGTPPIASAVFDRLSGPAPLTVNIDMRGSTDPDGAIQSYTIVCHYSESGYAYAGPMGSCEYTTPGTYWIMLKVKDNAGLTDLVTAYATVTPTPSTPPVGKQSATVTLSNLTQSYTGSPLQPSVSTAPPGLRVVWTNAPQVNAGSYAVTATIDDPNYQGSAGGTFVIAKAAATVVLNNLTLTATGTPLTPAVTTTPPGLTVTLTNAPQSTAGSYPVTATINDPNYQGSASGIFTINKAAATVTLGNLTRSYTGTAQTPTAATNPPGLAISWTNAPRTAAGTYTVTATVTDSTYEGSATGTFVINKATATVTLSNLSQTFTGQPLKPAVTTNPTGLAIVWTNAPQINAGSYSVTATINDPNYQGSAAGTFTVNKAPATVTLSNLTRTYTGSAQSPAAATNPPGLAILWTNAPQTNLGSYAVTASVSDPNFQGSASGTFSIVSSPVTPVPPAISITRPGSGTVQRNSTVNIEAAVSPGSYPLTRIDFLVNGTVKCSDVAAPYACGWSVPASPGKTYEIQAKAYDTGGQTAASAIVRVTSVR